ncbi:MAG: hypothetical protein ACLUOF_00385 [Ruminococcus sp.]
MRCRRTGCVQHPAQQELAGKGDDRENRAARQGEQPGTLTDLDITLDKLESYSTNANGDLEISSSAWSKLTYLTGMTVYFQRISDSIPRTDANDDGNCYVQIHGTPTTEKDITPHGVLKTDYSFGEHDQTALDQTVEDIVVLNVSKVLPELKASVHAIRKDGTEAYKEQSVSYDKNGNAHPVYPTLAVPNRSKTEQTWYQFLLTNNSRSTSSHALLQPMDSVGNSLSTVSRMWRALIPGRSFWTASVQDGRQRSIN